jgi:hypothetical protein
MKTIFMACLAILSMLCMASQSQSASSSANYAVKAASLSSGSGSMASENYSTLMSIGAVGGNASSAHYASVIGFLTPAITDTAPPANAAFASAPSDPDNRTSVTFTVTLPGDAAWYKYRLDDLAWSAPIGADTTSFTVSGLSEGRHTVRVITADALGNWQAADAGITHSWTVDATAPVVELSGVPVGEVNTTAAVVSVGGEGVTQYRYRLDAGSWSAARPVAQQIVLSGLAEGAHTLFVVVADALGNWQSTETPTSASWTVDLTVPGDPVIPPGDNPGTQTTPRPTLRWTAVSGAAQYLIEVSDSADFASPLVQRVVSGTSYTLADIEALVRTGIWYWRVRALDAAGNQGNWVTGSFEYKASVGIGTFLLLFDE